MSTIFTPANTEAAAILGGDPNAIHYPGNEFGVQIVGGLHQLAYAIVQQGWHLGKTLEIKFREPIAVPSQAEFIPKPDGFVYKNTRVLTEGKYSDGLVPKFEAVSCFRYFLSDATKASSNWSSLDIIPRKKVAELLGNTEISDLCAALMLPANALARTLAENPSYLPWLYFPKVREEGHTAVLEDRIVLHMVGNSLNNPFSIETSAPMQNPNNKRGVILSVQVNGVYSAEIYLTGIPIRALSRVLKAD